MIIKSILFILPILSTTFAATFEIQYKTKDRSPEERRKLGLFPKTSKKFVMTEKPTEIRVALVSKENNKRTLMPKLIIKNRDIESTKYYFYKEPVTRRPLMKYKKFIMDPTSTQKGSYATFDYTKRIPHEESVENDYLEDNDDHSSKEDNFKSDKNFEVQESIEEDNFTTESTSTDTLEMENNKLKRDTIPSIDIITYPNTSGENEDLEEFIFVKNIAPKFVNEEEFTADSSASDIVKRAVNVIEEENLGTTISVFKFTGRNTYLTNDLNYKNINS